MAFAVGDRCFVAIDSWAGRSTHYVRIERIDERRARVRWLGPPVFNKRTGKSYSVPVSALRRGER